MSARHNWRLARLVGPSVPGCLAWPAWVSIRSNTLYHYGEWRVSSCCGRLRQPYRRHGRRRCRHGGRERRNDAGNGCTPASARTSGTANDVDFEPRLGSGGLCCGRPCPALQQRARVQGDQNATGMHLWQSPRGNGVPSIQRRAVSRNPGIGSVKDHEQGQCCGVAGVLSASASRDVHRTAFGGDELAMVPSSRRTLPMS